MSYRDMSWRYEDGHFYVNEAGNTIEYLEVNPCRCCPDSVLREVKSPLHKKPAKTTLYLGIHFKTIEEFIKYYKLRRLE